MSANFRPVATIQSIGRIVKKCVPSQLAAYLTKRHSFSEEMRWKMRRHGVAKKTLGAGNTPKTQGAFTRNLKNMISASFFKLMIEFMISASALFRLQFCFCSLQNSSLDNRSHRLALQRQHNIPSKFHIKSKFFLQNQNLTINRACKFVSVIQNTEMLPTHLRS